MAEAGLNAYRFSIEWARIEPEEGKFDDAEIEHYRKVLDCCWTNGVEPLMTLFHFTSPVWLIQKGGWEADTTPAYFARYVRYVMERLGDKMHYACTINEANQGLLIAGYIEEFQRSLEKKQAAGIQVGIDLERMEQNKKYAAIENEQVFGTPDPKIFSSPRTLEGDLLVMKAHAAAREVIREVCPQVKVGLSVSVHDLQAFPASDAAAQQRTEQEWQREFAHYLPYLKGDDFLGIQSYTRTLVAASGTLPVPDGAETTQMGYEYYPECVEHVLRRIAGEFDGELIVTESGIATADDARRVAFLKTATDGVARCVADDLPVKGFFCWSLMDNYEWQKAYTQNFGLIAVNRKTLTRTPKASLFVLGEMREKD